MNLITGLQHEIRHLKDSNKAMNLYINEIIGRLLRTQGFEHVLEKPANRSVSLTSTQDRAAPEMSPRKTTTSNFDQQAAVAHKRLSLDSSGVSGGLSRAFSFRKRPADTPRTTIANLRPLKLVEEQQPQSYGELRSDTTGLAVASTSNRPSSREQPDDQEMISNSEIEQRITKRTSWVPGWFAKAGPGVVSTDGK